MTLPILGIDFALNNSIYEKDHGVTHRNEVLSLNGVWSLETKENVEFENKKNVVAPEFIFKKHIDLQKVSEIMFKNETFNVLKPTMHAVKDHFKDFIQNIPIYLDRNGFRHTWEGMEILKPHSLRKTDAIVKDIKKKAEEVKITKTNNSTNVKNKPRRKKKRIEEDIYVPEKPNLRDKSTLITTTFFCPFFGVIRMSTNVENFEENKTEQ